MFIRVTVERGGTGRRQAVLAAALACALAAAVPAAAQNAPDRRPAPRGNEPRGNEHIEEFTQSVRLGPNGRVSVSNVAGDITLRRVSGEELRIDAIKRTRGDRAELNEVTIDIVERGGRVRVATQVRRDGSRRGRSNVRVDYTIGVPGSAAIDVSSVSGTIRVDDLPGTIRAETLSGDVAVTRSPRVELAKSLAGTVAVSDTDLTGTLELETMSGTITVRQVKGQALHLSTVTGDADLTDVATDRVEMKSLSGDLQFVGRLSRTGRYAFNSHSGNLRFVLAGDTGFELSANSFSGNITSSIPVTLGGRSGGAQPARRGTPRERAVRGVFGDGSAFLDAHTFSGDITIERK